MLILSWIVLIIVLAVVVFMTISLYVAIFGGGPFVPTSIKAVKEVLKAADIKEGDIVYDLGAGDGRFVHFASKIYKAKSKGFEIDPFVFFLSKLRQWLWKWQGEMTYANFEKVNLKDADLIICYLLPNTLKKYQKKFEKELTKGTKIISYAFKVGNMKPIKELPRHNKISKIYLYEIQ
jgi:SAM-dependent methyltransferase